MNKRWVGWATCLILLPVLAACGEYERGKQAIAILDKLLNESGTTALLWDEEVTLHDGSVIVIKRREVKSSGGFPINTMNSRGITRSYEFCYPAMGLYWKSKGKYQPEILGIVNGKAYVKVPIYGEELCMLHDYPATNALYFVWENNAWKKNPL